MMQTQKKKGRFSHLLGLCDSCVHVSGPPIPSLPCNPWDTPPLSGGGSQGARGWQSVPLCERTRPARTATGPLRARGRATCAAPLPLVCLLHYRFPPARQRPSPRTRPSCSTQAQGR
ncbi:hypothetical protein CALCODRAFT_308944 [Calocera cornea HHB12733]|uniref:Uncharacterized protein n=1 Tax=Calocera cornea HHB12733 TaxID=1353952 RepID=A0A165FH16_9BASI|nr:hypothetical protein CALCODRAFT_308944 [Calocera cornea HHB12733]